MEYRESYEEWLRNPYFDEATKEEGIHILMKPRKKSFGV